jgi:tetratricopeptide (TPR) repeat protein
MPKGHLSDSRIIELLVTSEPAEPHESRDADRAHMAGCNPCQARLGEYRQLATVLGHAAIWDQRTISVLPLRDWLRRITAVMQQIHDERLDAEEILSANLKDPSATWRANLALIREVHTLGMIERLIARAEASFASNPVGALDLATLAVEIADELRIDSYPFDLVVAGRARSWRELAYALCYLGRFADALYAIDRAEQLFRQVPVHEFELSRTALIRSLIYRSTDRVAEAIGLTRTAGETFLAFGDQERYVKARMTEAAMLFHAGRVAEALDVWKPLEDEPSLQDTASLGMLLQNLGTCYRQLGDWQRAREYYARALSEHERQRSTAEIVRTRWSLAVVLVMAGQFHDALPVLRRTWKEFNELSMESDAALVGLELAETLLILEQPDEVPSICRTLLDRFTRNNMTSRAVTALAFLREAVAAGKATPALVRHVHDYLHDLPKYPRRSYAPPEP